MSHNILIQLFYYGTIATMVGIAFSRYLSDYLKIETTVKIKEEILKISFILFTNYLIIITRILMEYYGIINYFICYLFMLEVFINLFITFTLLKLFYYIRISKTPNFECQKKGIVIILSDFFIWIMLSILIFFSLVSGETAIDFVLNLRIFYLLPYSLTILAVFFMIPKDIKSFNELKIGFFFLFIAFLSEFFAKYLGHFDEKLVYEIIFSVKFFSIVTLVFNFYRMTLMTPDEKTGCEDED